MKIFILGPQAAGKTVFLSMFNRFIATQRRDLVLEALDFATTQYVTRGLAALEQGEWPLGNVRHTSEHLKWRFGKKSNPSHHIEMIDCAGQDLEAILMNDDPSQLRSELAHIRSQIDDSDLIIFLLDLEGFIGTKNLDVQGENYWYLKTFLSRNAWRNKARLLVVSKADIYSPTLNKWKGDIKALISDGLTKDHPLGHLVDANTSVQYFAVSSVKTISKIGRDERPERVPLLPLLPGDMNPIVDEILHQIRRSNLIQSFKRFLPALLVGTILLLTAVFVIQDWDDRTFEITFYTGESDSAGTDATVHIELNGSQGSRKRFEFDGTKNLTTNKDPFEIGSIDTYSVDANRIGVLQSILVGHDNTGHKPEWYLYKVDVQEKKFGICVRKYSFNYGNWLDTTHGTEKTIQPSFYESFMQ